MRPFWVWLILAFALLPAGRLSRAASLSDVALEALEKEGVTAGARNPFAPSSLGGEIDLESLTLEGLLLGPTLRLGLISGKIVQAGTTVGPFKIQSIESDKIVLLDPKEEEQSLRLEGYLPPLQSGKKQGYQVEFRNADIRDALRMLSKAEGLNLITPEDLGGRVNLSFHDISLHNAMRAILKVNNYSYAIENGVMRVGKPDEFLGGTDLMATTFTLKYAKAGDLEDPVKLLLSDKGSVAADARTNLLSVKDYDANIESVRRFIDKVDRRDDQVAIEAHIIDATNNFSRNLGVQWGITGTPSRMTVQGGDTTGTLTVGTTTPTQTHVDLGVANPFGAGLFRIGRLPGGTNIDLQISAAQERGDVRILSKPSVTTINNTPASIKSGVTIYVKANSDINIGTTGSTAGATGSNLQAIETGIQLDVTPQITPNRYVKLTIEANESEADFSRTVDGIPAVIDNTATTTVILRNGETAVIGGLIKNKDSRSDRSVPGLSKIPVVGLFFKSKSKSKTQNELMVFITPRILE